MHLVDRMWNVLVLKLAVYTDSKHLDSKDLIKKKFYHNGGSFSHLDVVFTHLEYFCFICEIVNVL